MDLNQPVGKSSKKSTPLKDHRRQMLVQVWLPLAASIVIVLALMILTILGATRGSAQVNKWGNISAVYCIIPILFAGLILAGITGGSAYGVRALVKKIPGWFITIHMWIIHFALLLRRWMDASTKPVLAANSFSAKVGAFKRRIFG